MPLIRIDATRIVSWRSFHKVFKETLGFPEFYGNNMNAWIDCMSDLLAVEDHAGMSSSVSLKKNESLILELVESSDFQKREPEICAALIKGVETVNQDYSGTGSTVELVLL